MKPILWEYAASQSKVHLVKEVGSSNYPYAITSTGWNPGHSGFWLHGEQTQGDGKAAILIADAFVFVTNGSQPNLTQPAIKLFQELHQNGGINIMNKGFAVVTKLDLLESEFESRYVSGTQEISSLLCLDLVRVIYSSGISSVVQVQVE